VARALVGEVVAVDARQHDVVQPDFVDGVGDVCGFVIVECVHPPGFDVTEVTATRAAVAHEHERRRAGAISPAPALAHVRAVGLLTDRVEVALAEGLLDFGEALARRWPHLQPLGFSRPTHYL
jgi:hypothetical protein